MAKSLVTKRNNISRRKRHCVKGEKSEAQDRVLDDSTCVDFLRKGSNGDQGAGALGLGGRGEELAQSTRGGGWKRPMS